MNSGVFFKISTRVAIGLGLCLTLSHCAGNPTASPLGSGGSCSGEHRLDKNTGPLVGSPTHDQDGIGYCGTEVASRMLQTYFPDHPEISALQLAMMRPSKVPFNEKHTRSGPEPLWFESSSGACEWINYIKPLKTFCASSEPTLENLMAITTLSHDLKVGKATFPANKSMYTRKLLLQTLAEYLDHASRLPPDQLASVQQTLKSMIEASTSTSDFLSTPLTAKDFPTCSDPQVAEKFSHLQGVLNSPELLPVARDILGQLSQPSKKSESLSASVQDTLNKACKDLVSVPKGIQCKSYMGAKSGAFQDRDWTPIKSYTGDGLYIEPDPLQQITGLGVRTYDDTIAPKIRHSLDRGRAVGVGICAHLLYVDSFTLPYSQICPRSPDGITKLDHFISIIGYRNVRNPVTHECTPEYLILNSWGATCEPLGKVLRGKCEEDSGKFWIPEKVLKENTGEVSFIGGSGDNL